MPTTPAPTKPLKTTLVSLAYLIFLSLVAWYVWLLYSLFATHSSTHTTVHILLGEVNDLRARLQGLEASVQRLVRQHSGGLRHADSFLQRGSLL